MMRRISLPLGLVLFLATNAWAQLASQTALVGTVTDAAGLVVPGAQVVAVNVGTKDTHQLHREHAATAVGGEIDVLRR